MAGHAATPLARKLGIAAGHPVAVIGAPATYRRALEPLPERVTFVMSADAARAVVHLFTTVRADLAGALADHRATLAPDAIVRVSWPKKAAKVPTDITEDVIRAE